jgi:hypothetical protein
MSSSANYFIKLHFLFSYFVCRSLIIVFHMPRYPFSYCLHHSQFRRKCHIPSTVITNLRVFLQLNLQETFTADSVFFYMLSVLFAFLVCSYYTSQGPMSD